MDPNLDIPGIAESSSSSGPGVSGKKMHKDRQDNDNNDDDDDNINIRLSPPVDTSSTKLEHLQSPAFSKPTLRSNEASAMPTRWWYAQTAFPLCAGTFGPMANAFSICALVERWRVEIPPGGQEANATTIKDPKWLIIVNAISLACALIANMSLLLNMAKRLSFSVAQSVTIVGFWVSSILLLGLIVTASYDFRAPGVANQALTQAYYYACWAAGLYQVISYLMCVTVYGALKGKYEREFQLTTPQRTLMLQTISFLAYMLIGALVFSHVEDWRYLDAVYWADFTLLTVGIGDYAPATHLGRGLLFPFAVGGIVILGLVVSSIRSMVLDRGKQKLSARMTEKIRKAVVKDIEIFRTGEKRLRRRRTGVSPEMLKRIAVGPSDVADEELERRQAEFHAMRRVQDFSERRQKWMNLLISVSAWAMLWFFGALVFMYTEKNQQQWSYFVSTYFAYTSLLTIGYGDIYPESNSGKAFFVFWSLLAIPSLTIVISDMSDTVVRFVKDATIWLGEVTILPSEKGTMLESLERGLCKVMQRQSSSNMLWTGKKDKQQDSSSSSTKEATTHGVDQQPENMGKLRRLIRTSKETLRLNPDATGEDRVAKTFEESEKKDEDEARARHDRHAESVHRYRRQLISQIRKLYADSHESPPKKYSYEEWAYFLRLLGEDESSSDYHKLAPSKPRHLVHQGTNEQTQQGDKQTPQNSPIFPTGYDRDKNQISKWSWIGPQSPLMSEKNEPALLLEMFFERLEDHLKRTYKTVQERQDWSRAEHSE